LLRWVWFAALGGLLSGKQVWEGHETYQTKAANEDRASLNQDLTCKVVMHNVECHRKALTASTLSQCSA